MADEAKPVPNIRTRRIAQAIAAWREESGQTLEEVASGAGWSKSKQSRLENAAGPITPVDVVTLAMHFRRPVKERESLFQDAQTAQTKQWWDQISADAFAADVRSYVALEAEAEEVRTFKIDVIPGLFQTESYARAMEYAALFPEDQDADGVAAAVEERVGARIQRQSRLTDDTPLRVRAILAEAALRNQVGGTEVWREQLQRLAELMTLPNVEIRFQRPEDGAYLAMGQPFSLLTFAKGVSEVGYVELRRVGVYLEKDAEVREQIRTFDVMWESAAGPDASAKLLAGIIEGIDP
ncbi:helix-turn-helix transcriptional regulator [Amycolatopsis sp. NPDC047767]|uniref:helix-turn-helix domain-containing protein n=1 Tax=Amycolatopsis sp. NPDC047767 TaxID=3156765 RepID=UPI0034516779